LPFLDLFDFLLKKSIYEAIKKKGKFYISNLVDKDLAKEVDFLNNNMGETFSNGIAFSCFATFANEDGIFQLNYARIHRP
jgi:hypothetical protein